MYEKQGIFDWRFRLAIGEFDWRLAISIGD
jgi:hypothetical protein